MEEQNQDSVNFEIPNRWRRFSAYLLNLLINLTIILFIPLIILMTGNYSVSLIIIIISVILEIIIITCEWTTTWYQSAWIITLYNGKSSMICWFQSILRHFIFNPAFLPVILLSTQLIIFLIFFNTIHCNGIYDIYNNIIIYNENPICEIKWTLENIANRSGIIGLILLFISIIEIFFKCPTFIDKLIWVKRIYNKSK